MHDIILKLSLGKNRFDTNWSNVTISYQELLNKLKDTTRTEETLAEYKEMSREKQNEIKDIGGFVGGHVLNGRRRNVISRSLIALDADHAYNGFWDDISLTAVYAMAIYTTHKHTIDNPRYRLLIPLNRDVTPEEYEAIARKVAQSFGLDYFDDTTYQPKRLMYWPSTSKDGDYFFDYIDAPILDADLILRQYSNWQDTTQWPESSRSKTHRANRALTQEDPLLKEGAVGDFCRAYTIEEAIETFLSDVYIDCGNDRYTYVNGTTSAGVIIYDNKFSFSHHSTDPTSGRLCNAFDLVRLHKFSHLDDDSDTDAPPSWAKMVQLVKEDTKCRKKEIEKHFGKDCSWLDNLTYTKGRIDATLNNIIDICKNDENLNRLGKYDTFCNRIVANRDLPWIRHSEVWVDSDTIALRQYLESNYRIDAKAKVEDSIERVFTDYATHSVREYLDALTWDNTPRLDTLFIDYLGADDNIYIREITRKTLVAGIKRIYQPGCEFQQCLVLCGSQGCGKSYLCCRLGKSWFSDTPGNLSQQTKDKYENLDGVWVMEWSENNMSRKADKEAVRAFISMKVARYRPAYGKKVCERPIQNITIITTNEQEFLSEYERRHWTINLYDKTPRKKVKLRNLPDSFFDQIWAEAKYYYLQGEDINELSEQANEIFVNSQKEHIYEDEWQGLIEDFLEKEIPENWYDMPREDQMSFISGIKKCVTYPRDKVCTTEIADILLHNERKDLWRIKKCLEKIEGWRYIPTATRFGRFGVRRGFHKKGKYW